MKRGLLGFLVLLLFFTGLVSVFSTDYEISFVFPTPNNETISRNYAYINVTLNDTPNATLLDWDGTNLSMSGSGTNYYRNMTSLDNGNYTFRVWANDNDNNLSVSEDAWVYINYTPPAAPDNPPTVTLNSPSDGSTDNDGTVTFSCSASDDINLINVTLYHNYTNWHANETNSSGINDTYYTFTKSFPNATTVVWNCLAYDNASNSSWASSNRTVNIAIAGADTTNPTITAYSITPSLVQNGSSVRIGINASDNVAVDSVWAVITKPNGATENISLTNNAATNYASTSLVGDYTVTLYANDTSDNETSVSGSFYSGEQLQFSVSVVNYNQNGINSSLIIYYSGTTNQVGSYSNSTGDFRNKNIIDYVYDFLFKAYDDDLHVLLMGVNISLNLNRTLGLEKLATPVSGYVNTYAVNSTYTISSARVTVYYPTGLNESNLAVYICSEWDFAGRSCTGSWNMTTATQNTAYNYFDIEVSGFSAFSVKEGGYCGDGTCGPGEDVTSCSEDCWCTSGETRFCSVAHNGTCADGNETCTAGSWTGCPSPSTEVCNTYDDDCDGIVDNVGGGTSINETQCQCYNGGSPVLEGSVCNNIDDDCNNLIDDGITRPCGNDTGKCQMGTRSCVNGEWSTTCQGEVRPDANETCGNNEDDDCDGEIDEGCASSLPCGYGLIPETGCKCGNLTYVAGYCCNGVYQAELCPEFPWWIFVVAGVVILVAYFVYEKVGKKEKETTWDQLEKRYTPTET